MRPSRAEQAVRDALEALGCPAGPDEPFGPRGPDFVYLPYPGAPVEDGVPVRIVSPYAPKPAKAN